MEKDRSLYKEFVRDVTDIPLTFVDLGRIAGTFAILFATHPLETTKFMWQAENHLKDTRVAKKITPIRTYSTVFNGRRNR